MALLLLLLFFTPAQAQTVSLSVWPPILTAMIQPGKSITQVYRLKNSADETKITVNVLPFNASDELGHIELQFGQPAPPFFSLLNADLPNLPVKLNLMPGETKELVLKIAIPYQAEEMDYPAALVIESDTQGLIGGSGAQAQATIASPILLTVSKTGLPQRLAKIEEFYVTRSHLVSKQGTTLLDSFDPVELVLRVKNQSFSLLQPIGQITINNSFGRTVATLPLEPDNILGGTIRQLHFPSWNPVLPLGQYTATVTLTPEDTTNIISGQIRFWVIPYKAILTLLILSAVWKLLLTNIRGGGKN